MNKIKKALSLCIILTIICGCSVEASTNIGSNEVYTINENTIQNNIIKEGKNLLSEPKILKDRAPVVTEVNVKMVGDCLIHSPLYRAARLEDGSYNFDFMFEHIKSDIEAADLAIINQETIFVANNNNLSSYPMFGSPTAVGDAEVKAGFDLITHATNHTIDKGIQGILDTITFWNTNYPNIKYIGIHENENESDIEYITKNDITMSFVNYTYGLNGLESRRQGNEYMIDMLSDKDIESSIKEASENSDITFALLHVGTEYVYKPTEYQVQQVKRCIDAGADVVICTHPHVVEPVEYVTTDNGNTGLVFYSLGNFISNQNEIPRILGGMADITIKKTIDKNSSSVEISNYDMIPLVTHQEVGYYSTYKLSDYTDELCKKHKLYGKGLSINKLNDLWNGITSCDMP